MLCYYSPVVNLQHLYLAPFPIYYRLFPKIRDHAHLREKEDEEEEEEQKRTRNSQVEIYEKNKKTRKKEESTTRLETLTLAVSSFRATKLLYVTLTKSRPEQIVTVR